MKPIENHVFGKTCKKEPLETDPYSAVVAPTVIVLGAAAGYSSRIFASYLVKAAPQVSWSSCFTTDYYSYTKNISTDIPITANTPPSNASSLVIITWHGRLDTNS